MAKKYLAYCRVSTKAQADRDNSLPTQKRIIGEYAERKGWEIVEWYSEAKSGYKGKRGEFYKMIEHLKAPEIEGVIFHKLDRSSRNVSDFSVLDRLMTQGKRIAVIEGEFDTSRSAGRLAFRNFCNLCVWYSENLSEEVTTKMQEVLMRGYFPGHAPIGYRTGIKSIDDDPKKKYIDENLAPYVKESFELFATGNYSIRSLCDYMRKKGMTNKSGGELRKGVFERMLRDPFYYGLMAWGKRRGNVRYYEGNHQPLISKRLFKKVQDILDGRTQKDKTRRDHTYAKLIKCECGHFLTSGIHKGRVYLECKNTKCEFGSIREDRLEDQIVVHLAKYELDKELFPYYEEAVERLREGVRKNTLDRRKALNLQIGKLDKKLDNLHQAVLGGVFSPEEAIEQKNEITKERHTLRSELEKIESKMENALWDTTLQVIGLFNFLPYRFKELNPLIKRRLLNFLFVNRQLQGNKLLIQAVPAFEKIKIANNLLHAKKLIVNQQLHGQIDLKQALPHAEKELVSSNLNHGRSDRARTCDLLVPNQTL